LHWRKVFLVVAIGWIFLDWWGSRAVSQGPGVLAPSEPVQETISNPKPIRYKNYTITPLAKFSAQARVLGKERYYIDGCSGLSKFDLALGWKRMSDETILKKFSISQSSRFYAWYVKELPIPETEIISSSANMHIISTSKPVSDELKRVRNGNIIKFSGYLVKAERDDGWTWQSSLTREDSGYGACEVVLVNDLKIVR
jgi:hypothetical protein